MIESLLIGIGFAFAAAVQPGPLQAFLVSRVATTGWRRTLPACLAPLLSDGPIVLIVLLVLGGLSPRAQHALRAGGGVLLLILAGLAFRQWRRPAARDAGGGAPQTLAAATLVNFLNPNVYLAWSLVLGPSVLAAWREHPAHAVVLVCAFYVTMIATTAAFVLLVGTARILGPRAQAALAIASTLILAALGLFLLLSGVRHSLGLAGLVRSSPCVVS